MISTSQGNLLCRAIRTSQICLDRYQVLVRRVDNSIFRYTSPLNSGKHGVVEVLRPDGGHAFAERPEHI